MAAPAKASTAEYKVVAPTSSPIKHVVVLFGENESFDHYFGTYPYAANTDGTTFKAKPGTPKVNGLYNKITSSGPTGPLLTANANQYNPKRLTHSQALTCDQNHAYTPEQQAFDGGKMDKFVEYTETDTCTGQPILFGEPGLVMDYYDGNTVTGLWNYAQNYAMSDNNYDTQFGPSTPGALNVISGNTGGGYAVNPTTGAKTTAPTSVSALNSKGVGSIYGDLDPAYDDCSDSSHTSTSPVGVETGKNIGDLLNAKHVTWGWFQGGFAPTSTNAAGYAVCGATHDNIGGIAAADYSPHHNPFEYYKSTSNPKHLPPSSEAMIGQTDQANHQYDLSDFATTLKDGNMPAVSYLKAAEYQDAHPGYSDPLDEQNFLVNTVNEIEQSKYWKSTAIVITYDDSDGWYDHVDGAAAQRLARRHHRPGRVHEHADPAGLDQRPLWLRSPAAAGGHLPVHQVELRQPQRDRSVLGDQLHREQLAARAADRQRLIRQDRRQPGRARWCAGLQGPAELQAAHPQPHHWRGRQQALAPPTRTTRPRWPGQRAPATAATFARVHRAEGRAS